MDLDIFERREELARKQSLRERSRRQDSSPGAQEEKLQQMLYKLEESNRARVEHVNARPDATNPNPNPNSNPNPNPNPDPNPTLTLTTDPKPHQARLDANAATLGLLASHLLGSEVAGQEEEFILVHGEKYVHINHVHKHGRHASSV